MKCHKVLLLSTKDNNSVDRFCFQVGDVNIVKALIVFGADLNAKNKKNETPRHLATISKSRFRNQMIHALCLVGAAPCDPRKCNYQCNTPFNSAAFPLGKIH